MFVEAITKAAEFTRPVFTIGRRYGSSEIEAGASTIFFVNNDGWAITSRGVARTIAEAGAIERKYRDFKKKKSELSAGMNFEDELRALEELMGYKHGSMAQLKVNFVDCVDKIKGVECKMHPRYDIALVHFDGFDNTIYKNHAVFAGDTDTVNPGKYLCRLGYPFPEFNNYKYDEVEDDICWTAEGIKSSPRFPMDGMVTRLIGSQEGLEGIEMSTPGFAGQGGGPLFDNKGIVYGMQSVVTKLNLGKCIHFKALKEFMKKEKIKFYELNDNGLVSAVTGGNQGDNRMN